MQIILIDTRQYRNTHTRIFLNTSETELFRCFNDNIVLRIKRVHYETPIRLLFLDWINHLPVYNILNASSSTISLAILIYHVAGHGLLLLILNFLLLIVSSHI